MANRLVIACMDPRLTKALNEKYCDGETVTLRNAGSNILELEDSIKDILSVNDVRSITLVVHGAFDVNHPEEKCAAMREVYEVIEEEKKLPAMLTDGHREVYLDGKAVPASIMKLLVNQFKGKDYPTFKEVEDHNVDLQEKNLRALLKQVGKENIEVNVWKVKTSEVCVDYNEHRGEYYEKRVASTDQCDSSNYILASSTNRILPASEALIKSKGKTELILVQQEKSSPKNKLRV